MAKKFDVIELTEEFHAPPKNVFEALTDSRFVSTYTQAPAKIEAKEGGVFSLFDGGITGEFVSISKQEEKDKDTIVFVQKWRQKEWEENLFSTATITLASTKRGQTTLTLKQEGIPEADRYGHRDISEKVKNGWNNFFFLRIHKMLGF